MELLRFATAGSVDDGKSTLIGRLLYDSKAIFEDQLEAVERTSRDARRRVHQPRAAHRRPAGRARAGHHDRRRLPLLRHPEAQVHHRRHARPHAVHAQHGHRRVDRRPRADPRRRPQRASLEQSRRHAFLASLLGVPHLVLCVNKMDLVDYDQDVFERIKDEFREFATQARRRTTSRSSRSRRCTATTSSTARANMPWYEGTSLLHHLEEVHIASDRNLIDCRFPVQYVIRPQSTTSTTTTAATPAQVAGGVLKPGDEVVVLPSGFTSTHRVDRHRRRAGRRGVPADVGDGPARPTTSTSAAAT